MSIRLGEEAGARFDRLFLEGGIRDPHALYRELRGQRPVFWSEATRAWVLTRYEDVRRLLGDEDNFAVLSGEAGATIHGKSILQMRGTEHRKKNAVIARRLRNPQLLGGRIRDRVEEVSRGLLDDLSSDLSAVELRSQYTGPLPLGVISWMLGIDDPGGLAGWYRDLALAGVENLVGDEARRRSGLRALERFERLIEPVIRRRRQDPGEDLISILAATRYDGRLLDLGELKTLAGFLLTAGVETTDRTLASLFHHLGRHPADWTALRADPHLATAAVAEMLRFEPPVQGLGRVALADAEFGGVPIAEGERLIGLIASANRDPEFFDDPDVFDLRRFEAAADAQFTPAAAILAFGAGTHHCTGSLLAKLELTTAVRDFLTRFEEIEPVAEDPVVGVMLRSPESVTVRLRPADN